ncbi:MAG: hypothetical protein EKK55_02565 [Rhodocyclaceae bacterium]|nr:MAG: hypothetical protein EKK55_02565 [Rhodocyclaceae bacterium]
MNPQSYDRRFFLPGTPPVDEFPTSGGTQTTDALGVNFMRGRKTVQIAEKTSSAITANIKIMGRARKDMPYAQVGSTITATGFYGFDEDLADVKLEITGHSAGIILAALSGWNEEHG